MAYKTLWDFFLGSKTTRGILGDDFEFTDEHKAQVEEFFTVYNTRDPDNTWRRNIAIWIKYGVNDWVSRKTDLQSVTQLSADWHKLMYGEHWKQIYNQYSATNAATLPTRKEYWLNKGYTEQEAENEVSKIQKEFSDRSPASKKGAREYSHRCAEYWIAQGYTLEEANKAVSDHQTRDLDFYISKYGEEEGTERYEQTKSNRLATWDTKDKQEHAKVTTNHTYNPNGQEMQAVTAFLDANDIPAEFCRYGAPKDQFYQMIPGVGFRRYDLAVFDNYGHSKLKYIMEFHGPGHINFSDYHPDMEYKTITINGKELDHLGTYGKVYHNDLAKRTHIINNYPNVKYCVMWVNDLKEKRFTIEQLS
jgi:hypothetical protein